MEARAGCEYPYRHVKRYLSTDRSEDLSSVQLNLVSTFLDWLE